MFPLCSRPKKKREGERERSEMTIMDIGWIMHGNMKGNKEVTHKSQPSLFFFLFGPRYREERQDLGL